MRHFAPRVRAFLRAIQVMPQVSRAARAAGIRPCQHYRMLKTSLKYRAAFDACFQIGLDALSDVAVERAGIGWDEPVVYKGQLSYPEIEDGEGHWVPDRTQAPFSVRKIDNNLLQFVLRNRHPDYREQREERNPEAATAPPLIIQTWSENDSPDRAAEHPVPNDSPLQTAVENLR